MAIDKEKFEELRAGVEQLRPILADEQRALGYLSLFDEFVRETELGLALHTVCDYLLESETPRPEATTVEQIRALHTSMEIEDDCLGRLRQKAGRIQAGP